jgi:hypothetical protein
MNGKSMLAGIALPLLAGFVTDKAQARDRGFEASPSVWSLYNQGYIAEACWEAYNKDRQWRWMLWCVNHFIVNNDLKTAERFFGNAYHSALDWAEYGWSQGSTRSGCDRGWGIMGLQAVVNSVAAVDPPPIRQQAATELARITSQNPPRLLHGPWVWPGVGNIEVRQNGAAFDGVTKNATLVFVYDRNNPFRRFIDPGTRQPTPWWVGNFTWKWATTTTGWNGTGYFWVHDDFTCNPKIQWWDNVPGKPVVYRGEVQLTRP